VDFLPQDFYKVCPPHVSAKAKKNWDWAQCWGGRRGDTARGSSGDQRGKKKASLGETFQASPKIFPQGQVGAAKMFVISCCFFSWGLAFVGDVNTKKRFRLCRGFLGHRSGPTVVLGESFAAEVKKAWGGGAHPGCFLLRGPRCGWVVEGDFCCGKK